MELLFSIIGLIVIGIGTYFLARNFIITKERAIELGVSRVCSDDPKENLKLPAVKDRLNQRRDAVIGLILVGIGISLGITGLLIDYSISSEEGCASIFRELILLSRTEGMVLAERETWDEYYPFIQRYYENNCPYYEQFDTFKQFYEKILESEK